MRADTEADQVSMEDFESAISQVTPTATEDNRQEYQRMMERMEKLENPDSADSPDYYT